MSFKNELVFSDGQLKQIFRTKKHQENFIDLKPMLTLSWWRPLSYRNQSIDLQSKSMDWFLYDNGLRHERVKIKIRWVNESFPTSTIKTITICQGPKKA